MAAVALAVVGMARGAGAEPRAFAFAQDARNPRAGAVGIGLQASWGFSGATPVLPVGSDGIGANGGLYELEAEVGIASFLSVRAVGLALLGTREQESGATGGGEVRAQLIGLRGGPFQLAIGVGGLRSFENVPVLTGRLVASGSIGRVRLTGDVLFEHEFEEAAAPVGVIGVFGGAYEINERHRVGVEVMAQDPWAAVDLEHRRGPRLLVGPTTTVNVRERFNAVASVLFGITDNSPDAVLRLGLSYEF